ncbi:unnamed protein product [Sphenostylis stenocarpa]|uniref:FHA domain-containing protein n=1 Tax=Sphenostylis stenocarpa TaxID=92480 RepID=A0AA86SJG3_9FABA|nr:unnamed protein product [Sphenostylis stenocarpa]
MRGQMKSLTDIVSNRRSSSGSATGYPASPRQGEILDFKPGSAVQIGRIVKGNTLPIKDPDISSKHLSILNESAKWILRDLDSSNHTALDASQIPPNTPFPLHHDSTGEFTSIHVIFFPPHNSNMLSHLDETPRAAIELLWFRFQPRFQWLLLNMLGHATALGVGDVENLIRVEEKVEESEITGNPNLFEISDSSDENLNAPVTERGVAGKRELEKEGEDRNGVKEACDGKEKGNLNEDDGNWLDLNKMTLGEWIDFLEFHLPKQIDETNEMIDSMTQKAERLCEYIAVMQQHNIKGKMPRPKCQNNSDIVTTSVAKELICHLVLLLYAAMSEVPSRVIFLAAYTLRLFFSLAGSIDKGE